jgi:hypothetical protein
MGSSFLLTTFPVMMLWAFACITIRANSRAGVTSFLLNDFMIHVFCTTKIFDDTAQHVHESMSREYE